MKFLIKFGVWGTRRGDIQTVEAINEDEALEIAREKAYALLKQDQDESDAYFGVKDADPLENPEYEDYGC